MARNKTTGRYETREELEATIRHLYFDTPAKAAQIARITRISEVTCRAIICSFHTTTKEKQP